jgi:hypothetical protein
MDRQIFPSLPHLGDLISFEKILPNEWWDKKNNKKYTYPERIEIIEQFEFIIACVIKAVSFLEIDGELFDKVNSIYSSGLDNCTAEYFNCKSGCEQLLFIIQFIGNDSEVHYSGLNDEERIINFCNCWRECYEFIFGKSEEFLNIKNEINKKNNKKSRRHIFLVKHFQVPEINYKLIYKLLDRLSVDKERFKELNTRYGNTGREQQSNKNNYSEAQHALLGHKKEYEHIMEALQNINGKDCKPYIVNIGGFFELNMHLNLMTFVIKEYCKKYRNKKEYPDIEWSLFNNCMNDKEGKMTNLKENWRKSVQKPEGLFSIIDEISKFVKDNGL